MDLTITLPEVKKGRKSKQDKILYQAQLKSFADNIKQVGKMFDDKVSARGWCYLLEGAPFHLIDKSQFDYVFALINKCRKEGLLPIDFTLEDESRKFYNLESIEATYQTPKEYLLTWINYTRNAQKYKKDIGFWESQKYYIQMIVEKIDVRNIFNDTCAKYHIPIANAKGWSDLLTRAKLVWKYQEAEKIGLKPVLLYFGDFDPAGIFIGEKLRKNFKDIENATGWNPDDLIINVFGLTYDFITKHGLTWIDNLITGSKKNLADPTHPDHFKPYVQNYLKKYGPRKVEANAILIIKNESVAYCEETILKYIDEKASKEVYDKILKERQDEVQDFMDSINFQEDIDKIIENINNKEE